MEVTRLDVDRACLYELEKQERLIKALEALPESPEKLVVYELLLQEWDLPEQLNTAFLNSLRASLRPALELNQKSEEET